MFVRFARAARASMACADAHAWRNFLGRSCADYEARGLCRGGRALREFGDVFGCPELNCCACGRRETALHTSEATQIFFIAAREFCDLRPCALLP